MTRCIYCHLVKDLDSKASRMSFCSVCPVMDCCGYEPDECAKALLAWLLRSPAESEGKP